MWVVIFNFNLEICIHKAHSLSINEPYINITFECDINFKFKIIFLIKLIMFTRFKIEK